MKKSNDAILRTGALALAAAGASTQANAATVQITFNNSFISTTSGNHLVTDFGGDGTAERVQGAVFGSGHTAAIDIAFSVIVRASSHGVFGDVGREYATTQQGGSVSLSWLFLLEFTDGKVRQGSPTTGYLDVTANANLPGERGRITLNRVISDDVTGGAISGLSVTDPAFPEYAAAVPEPSGLGLIALGAGGLLARRRRTMAV